jgi:hypothetical protein
MRPQRIVAAVTIIGVVSLAVRALRRRNHPQPSASPPAMSQGDLIPINVEHADDLVSQASEDSFPASDPPSHWARDPLG